jgi:peptidoglycan/LPS O-acetylase OafA/YrhL
MWIASIGTIIAILVGLYPLQSVDNPASQVSHALFFALQRNTWGVAIAWIIFSCEMGYGGWIKNFLELSIWKPFGRMSLSFYLVHTLYIAVHVAKSRAPIFYNDIELVIQFQRKFIVSLVYFILHFSCTYTWVI